MPELIKTRLNALLIAIAVLVNLYQLLFLPLLLLPTSSVWLATLVPCILLSNPLWYLLHESFHSNLHSDADINESAGRLLSVFFGAPYFVVRFGHLMHHRFNGAPIDRPDLYSPETTSRPAATISYYWELCLGLYLAEMISFLFFLSPKKYLPAMIDRLLSGDDEATKKIHDAAHAQLIRKEVLRKTRIEALAVCCLLTSSIFCYQSSWYIVPLLLVARGFLISFANNIPHFDTNPDDVRYALNIRLSKPMSLFYLHFNYHRVHHHNPRLPWTELPAAFQQTGETFDTSLVSAALVQWKGPSPIQGKSLG